MQNFCEMNSLNFEYEFGRCVIGKSKFRQKCYARLTLLIAGYLKTEPKAGNSKKPKYKWDEKNIETDYFDLRSFSIQPHKCGKCCLKSCILKHSCKGHYVSRDRKRRHLDEARNYFIEFYTESTASAVKHADSKVGFGKPNAVEKEKPLSGVNDKFKILQDLCEAFDNFSESERKLNLFKYLGLFSRRDAIPDQY